MLRVVRYVAAALVVASGLLHLWLWNELYKDVPDENVGRSFLLKVIGSVVIAVALVVSRHWLITVAGLVLANGTLLAFALSRTDQGIFGFTERGFEPSPEAALALVFEIGAAVLLTVLLWRGGPDDDRRSVVVS